MDGVSIENSTSGIVVSGNDGNDSITNYSSHVTINGNSGSDYIYSQNYTVLINGNSGDDSILNGGHYNFDSKAVTLDSKSHSVSIDGGDGSDRIFSYGNNVSIVGGGGNDIIRDKGISTTIDGGDGNDSILHENFGNTGSAVIIGGTGNDWISNDDEHTSINAGDGKNTIRSSASYVTIVSENGDDYISSSGARVYVDAGDGKNRIIVNSDQYSTILSGSDADYVSIDGNYSSIDAGDGSDQIILNDGDHASIDAGSGDDYIDVTGKYDSINAGAGNDQIYITLHYHTIFGGEGDDTVDLDQYSSWNYVATDDGSDIVKNYGNYATVTTGDGNDSILNGTTFYVSSIRYASAGNSSINSGSGDDTINNIASQVTIDAGAGNDLIQHSGGASSINAGDGNDSIYSSVAQNKILGGTGDDVIINTGSYADFLDGGAGNDSIVNAGSSEYLMYGFSISGGSGIDTIVGQTSAWETFIYTSDTDIIYGFGSWDSITFDSARNITSSVESGNDVIITFDNDSTQRIIVKNVQLGNLNLAGSYITYQNAGSNQTSDSSSGSSSNGSESTSGSSTDSSGSNSGSNSTGSESISGSSTDSSGSNSESSSNGSESTSGSSTDSSGLNSGSNSSGSESTSSGSSENPPDSTGSSDSESGSSVDSSAESTGSDIGLDIGGQTHRTIIIPDIGSRIYIDPSNLTASNLSSGNEIAIIDFNSSLKSASLTATSDIDYEFTFSGGTQIDQWNATLSSGNDQILVDDVTSGNFNGGSGNDLFSVSSALNGNITLTGTSDSNVFHAQAATVSSSSDQNKITITDINFNNGDALLVDAGIENLTSEFFGDGIFKNYASAEDASTSGVYAGNVLDATDLVDSIGMSFSMLRMADGSVTLDDENAIDESNIYNVVWANTEAATINFETQTDSVFIFTNTNRQGDLVSLGGDFNDTIHAGKNDTIDAGGGDDLIYLEGNKVHVIFGNSEGNDTIYGWNSTDYLEFDSMPSSISISNGDLYLENENGTLLIDGSFTNSTDIKYSDGILRVGNSNGDVIYDRSVTYYAGSNLILDTSRGTSIDLSSSTYENISMIDASNGRGRDVFRYTSDSGNVTISNGDSRDVVDLSSYSIDEISTEFTDSGLIISINDSSLNIFGTNMTTFSLAGGRYTADFENQSWNS